MNPGTVKEIRRRMGRTQKELAEIVGGALGRDVSYSTIANYERGRVAVPRDVAAFLEVLDTDPAAAPVDPPAYRPGDDDTEPRDFDAPRPSPVLAVGSSYSHLCEQFFELVATAVGMVGAAVGSDALMRDGAIIDDDKKALGAAYGKLAETNETFRNLLVATDKQGAYLAVALTTGSVVGKIWRNHTVTNRDLEPTQLRVVDEPSTPDPGVSEPPAV